VQIASLVLSCALPCFAIGGSANIVLEDKIAKAFVSIRAEARLPKLARIKYREDLQGWTCTAAERGTSLDPWIYKTDNPLSSPQLRQRALAAQTPNDRPLNARFAVAVWADRSSETSVKQEFWVGINLYFSAWWEFFDNTFTDNFSHRND
jgi:hypothetical protein